MLESLKHIDTDLFLYLNGKHTNFFDPIMVFLSKEFVWIPLYAFLLFLCYKKFPKNMLQVIVAVTILITLSDQLSVHLFKNVYLRYRPCHNLEIKDLVHTVKGCGGMYGFISSHASNTFALATFLTLIFKGRYNYFGILIFSWATIVSYSRIYLGAHYPADVVCGAMFGILIGYLTGKIFHMFHVNVGENLEQTLS